MANTENIMICPLIIVILSFGLVIVSWLFPSLFKGVDIVPLCDEKEKNKRNDNDM